MPSSPRPLAPALALILAGASAGPGVSLAQDAPAAPPPASPAPAAKPAPTFAIDGVFALWGLDQRGFMLGADHPLDDADYVVQMLRLNARFGGPDFGAVARLDAAQGWWGVDNDPNVSTVVTTDADGKVSGAPAYNADTLFRNKDTNYPVHFDHAYVYARIPGLPVPVRVQAGRQPLSVGNMLVLDGDYDGIVATVGPFDALSLDLLWAKMSEGRDAFRIPTGALMSDADARADADLFGGRARLALTGANIEAYGLQYLDRSDEPDWTHLPQGLGYLRSRFTPNVTKLLTVGVSAGGTVDVAGGLSYKVEGSFLTGKDDVANAGHAGGVLDVNDGDIGGYNAYADLVQRLDVGLPLDVGVLFGLGSGDDDPREGAGNGNKIETSGNFALTNVWEDSSTPDIGGISPQGLGSPVSRGYREFENTTAVQARLGLAVTSWLHAQASYTFLKATAPVHAFDAAGTPTDATATDLGSEVDLNLTLKPYGGLVYKCLLGWFKPGRAAAYLIRGTDTDMDPAWEVKQVVSATF